MPKYFMHAKKMILRGDCTGSLFYTDDLLLEPSLGTFIHHRDQVQGTNVKSAKVPYSIHFADVP